MKLFAQKTGSLKSLSLLFMMVLLVAGLVLKSHFSGAKTLAPPSDSLGVQLPDGFRITLFAKLAAVGSPRMMALDTTGQLYVALADTDKVVLLPDVNQDGIAEKPIVVADNLNAPNSIAFSNDSMFISNQDGVVKARFEDGSWSESTPVIRNLPTGGHTLKTVRIGPDNHLYINVGSSCNVCNEENPIRATILRYTPDGQPAGALVTVGRHAPDPTWARGLRNSQAFGWHPVTGKMFATNEGADNRSEFKNGRVNDELPPEHFNQIEAGNHYGWPYCWGIADKPGVMFSDPNFTGPADFCQSATAPAITFISHSTPMGFAFLHAAKVPPEYKSDAIVALHGSWNRKKPSGYKLVRIKFKNNQPAEVVDFATGWLSAQGAWGRPVDVIVGKDGALYVSDDRSGYIYRITYQGNT